MSVSGRRDGPGSDKPDLSGTTSRIIRALEAVAEKGDFRLKDIAEKIDLPTSTVHRILQTFTALNLIEKTDTQYYTLGIDFFRISSLVQQKFKLQNIARDQLLDMAEHSGETCSFALYMRATRTGMIVDTIPTNHPLRYHIEPFTHWPLAWGSLGRSMLAYLPAEDVEAVLAAARASPATRQPVPKMADLSAELAETRLSGHYVSINQVEPGATGTAAAVLGPRGALVGSLGIAIPVQRYSPDMQAGLSEVVMRNARSLSASLGYRPGD